MNSVGEDVETGDIGLLLYNGGTVCGTGFSFSNNAANAICREMGQPRATIWKSSVLEVSLYYWEFGSYAQSLDITLDDVRCRESKWDTCSYSTTHNCHHGEDVYLACYSGSILMFDKTIFIIDCKIRVFVF